MYRYYLLVIGCVAHVVKWKYFHKKNMFCHGVSIVNWAAGFSAFINSKYVYCHNRIHWSSLINRRHSVHNQSKTVNEFNVVMSIKQYWEIFASQFNYNFICDCSAIYGQLNTNTGAAYLPPLHLCRSPDRLL